MREMRSAHGADCVTQGLYGFETIAEFTAVWVFSSINVPVN